MEKPTLSTRAAGVLLHVTSLPGPQEVGDLGAGARSFADFLAESGQRWWQTLPVVPNCVGNSPYNSLSTFAGNPLLISIEDLIEDGLLNGRPPPRSAKGSRPWCDYDVARRSTAAYLEKAFVAFDRDAGAAERRDLESFGSRHAHWLDDYALFAALKEESADAAWTLWPPDLRRRHASALASATDRLRRRVHYHRFVQWRFQLQWERLRDYAAALGVGLIGDLPIYVAPDSAEVWASPELFQLGPEGLPLREAGVPPDYFSETGQRWGNPLYDWPAHRADGFSWWNRRLQMTAERFDVVRLDHFIGFQRYWEIPCTAASAKEGRWVDGPGAALFEALAPALRRIEIIAEDLGVVTPEVTALRQRFEFPGMRVLQFAFDGDPATNPHMPTHHERRGVVYTGTHDNDTTQGWYHSLPEQTRARVRDFAGADEREIHWSMVRLVWKSVSDTAIAPAQDLVGLGSEARMNVPGKAQGNWMWRLLPGALDDSAARRLRALTQETDRMYR